MKQRLLEEKVLPMIAAQPRRKSNFDTLPREAWAVQPPLLGLAD